MRTYILRMRNVKFSKFFNNWIRRNLLTVLAMTNTKRKLRSKIK